MKRNCHFVLVPGAWMGSWVWDGVAAPLAAEGHDVTAVTLSGLADRIDVPASEIGLATHVEDISRAPGRGRARPGDPGRA